MKRLGQGLLIGLAGLLLIAWILLGLAFWGFSVYIAFRFMGTDWGLAAIFLPPVDLLLPFIFWAKFDVFPLGWIALEAIVILLGVIVGAYRQPSDYY